VKRTLRIMHEWKKEFGKAAFASGWLVTLNPHDRS
jgi:hypothetical protein